MQTAEYFQSEFIQANSQNRASDEEERRRIFIEPNIKNTRTAF